ncbi:MAG: branched-chain amino acid transporter [Waddliaceae bacterium]|nr:branched-chain amino acid transporter [Waddliaceae bacterium]
MKTGKSASALVIGLALFSMFFGSGNLIFPLFVGSLAQGQSLFAMTGFIATAVLLPFLGVIAMLVFQGNYRQFFARLLGERLGFILTAILLTVWIPLGSGPRCIVLAYGSLASYLSMPPLWVFSGIYSAFLILMVFKKNRLLDVLGYVLTPTLLACLFVIIMQGVFQVSAPLPSEMSDGQSFFHALSEGYNTMDLIAAFFFSASVIKMIKNSSDTSSKPLLLVFQACVVGMALLGIVYAGMIFLAAKHAVLVVGVPKDQLLSHLALELLGPQLGIVSAIAVAVACFTTSIALLIVYVDFLRYYVFPKDTRGRASIFLTLVGSFVMSIFGLGGITAVTAPVLKVLYPLLLIMIVVNVPLAIRRQKIAA